VLLQCSAPRFKIRMDPFRQGQFLPGRRRLRYASLCFFFMRVVYGHVICACVLLCLGRCPTGRGEMLLRDYTQRAYDASSSITNTLHKLVGWWHVGNPFSRPSNCQLRGRSTRFLQIRQIGGQASVCIQVCPSRPIPSARGSRVGHSDILLVLAFI
jgi:hypothetical protein